ncbi:hypothetical protein, partial [Acutalibacter muris]|uniref:hypothetical protein n=1 Tax=Acutalibacter muris TaxID=1796620 RepID=UPI00272EB331
SPTLCRLYRVDAVLPPFFAFLFFEDYYIMFLLTTLSRHSCISGTGSGRNVVTELLITSFPQ